MLHKEHDLWWRAKALAVPDHGTLRGEILREYHTAPYSGHVGVNRTVQSLQKTFWCPHFRDDILNHIWHCDSCQRNKSSTQKRHGETALRVDAPAASSDDLVICVFGPDHSASKNKVWQLNYHGDGRSPQ